MCLSLSAWPFRPSPIARTPEVKAQPPPSLPPPLLRRTHTNDLSPFFAPRPPSPLPSLPPQTTHFDKDERYMATSDLCTELKKDVKIDAQLERRCVWMCSDLHRIRSLASPRKSGDPCVRGG